MNTKYFFNNSGLISNETCNSYLAALRSILQ